jgi:hypothetical protein
MMRQCRERNAERNRNISRARVGRKAQRVQSTIYNPPPSSSSLFQIPSYPSVSRVCLARALLGGAVGGAKIKTSLPTPEEEESAKRVV